MPKTRTVAARLRWPRSADLRPWLERYLDSCEQLKDPGQGAARASIRLRQLAECGGESDAMRRLRRLLPRLPATDCQAATWLTTVGAEIALERGAVRQANQFIRLAEQRQATAKPADKRWSERRLLRLRASHGLATESDMDDDSDALAQIGRWRRRHREALASGDRRAALVALGRVGRLIPDVDDFTQLPGLVLSVIGAYRRLDDEPGVARYIAWLDKHGHSASLDTGSLMAIGLPGLARKRASNLIARRLKQLCTSDDPNVHFPVNDICEQLWLLLQTGDRATASRLLRRVLRELPQWRGLRGGFATSGALTELASLVAELDGPEAASGLLAGAAQTGAAERQPGFRRGALRAAKQVSEAPGTALAIATARELRPAKKRREALLPLLAKSGDWSGLAELLDEVSDNESRHDLLHSLLYCLPGGSRLA